MDVRSYRSVFELERRVYRLDTIRLNPSGVPLRGIAYAAVLIVVAVAAGRLPVVGPLLGRMPWYIAYCGAPIGASVLMTLVRIDGRAFHVAAVSQLGAGCAPRVTSGLRRCAPLGSRWQPGPIVFVADGSDAVLRPFRYTGPGAVLVCCSHRRAEWQRSPIARLAGRPDMTVDGDGDCQPLAKPSGIELGAATVLEVFAPGSVVP